MKNLILTTLSILFIGNVFAQQTAPVKADLSINMLDSKTETARYDLEITKSEKIVFKSKFELKNGEFQPLLSANSTTNKEKVSSALDTVNNNMAKNSIIEESKKHYMINMAWHTDGSNNMWTQFSITDNDTGLSANKLLAKHDKDNVQDGKTEPSVDDMVKNVVVIGKNKEETLFSWEDYTFKYKASF